MANKDIALIAHLMRRAGFGAPREELETRISKGYEKNVEELLDPDAHGIPSISEAEILRYMPSLVRGLGPPIFAQGNWMYRMLNTPRPLEEKMVLFWHQVFATGASKVDNSRCMTLQISMFRRCGMGNYRDLLLEVAKDPTMLFWLDNNENHKHAPNENWGRELLELFSMGQGNYTEKDVFECSRAFTGWSIAYPIPRAAYGSTPWYFEYRPEDHDDGEKEFLSHRGRFNGEDIINIIVQQPATAQFIARHLYNFFVADEVQVPSWRDVPPKDPEAVGILADALKIFKIAQADDEGNLTSAFPHLHNEVCTTRQRSRVVAAVCQQCTSLKCLGWCSIVKTSHASCFLQVMGDFTVVRQRYADTIFRGEFSC